MKFSKQFFLLAFFLTSQACAQEFKSEEEAILNSDERNKIVIFDLSSNDNNLKFCINDIGDTGTAMDVFRVFLHSADHFKDSSFENIELCFRGETRFILKGDDFQVLGQEYGEQNPMYIIRTFPEKLILPDGNSAYPMHTGGLLYLLRVQMDDFNDMNESWFMKDLLEETKANIEKQRPKEFAPDDEVF